MNFKPGEYEKFKQFALEKGVIRKIVSVGELVFVSPEEIHYIQGGKPHPFVMTRDAFTQFIHILGLSVGALKKIEDALGSKNTTNLITLMKAATSLSDSKHKICMLISSMDAKVVGFRKSDRVVLSNKGYLELFEQVMEANPNMEIKEMAITEGGNMEISTVNRNWQFNVAKLSDEYFNSGLVFLNTPQAMIINPYFERLICTNGNIVTEKGHSMFLNTTEDNALRDFMNAARNLRGPLNTEDNFKLRIIKMMETTASLSEVYFVHRVVLANVMNADFDRDVKVTLESLLPVKWHEEQFKAHGHDVTQMSPKDQAKIKTGLNVWQLANALTDIASNPRKHGLAFKYANSVFQMQRDAGELMFKKRYDHEEPFAQIFRGDELSGNAGSGNVDNLTSTPKA